MKRHVLFSGFLCAIAVFVCSGFATDASAGGFWSDTSIYLNNTYAQVNSPAVDDDGYYTVSYYESSGQDLMFARSINGGSDWTLTPVDTVNNVGIHNSLAVDGDTYLVAYYYSTGADLKFAKSTDGGQTWPTIVTVDGLSTSVGMQPSLAVDDDGNYIIVYRGAAGARVKLAKSTDKGLTWALSTIDAVTNAYDFSVAIGPANSYLVSYTDGSNFYLKFAQSTTGGSAWSVSTVDSSGFVQSQGPYYTAIATVPSGEYFIIYQYFDEINDMKIGFAKTIDNGLNWNLSLIDTRSGNEYFQSPRALAIDQNGRLLIAVNGDSLAMSDDLGGSWTSSTYSNSGGYPSVFVDTSNNYLSLTALQPMYLHKYTQNYDAPAITLTPLAPDPTADNTPTVLGAATDTIGTVASVEYQMDGTDASSWTACTADDGTFGDEASEDFTCAVISPVTDGTHTMYIRATDSYDTVTSDGDEATDTFVVDTTPPVFQNLPGTTIPINLSDGQIITSNLFLIQVKPDDPQNGSGIDRIEFYVDDDLLCTDIEADGDGVYDCSWNTEVGLSEVRVVVYDEVGNSAELTRTVTVDLSFLEPPEELEDTGAASVLQVLIGCVLLTLLSCNKHLQLKHSYPMSPIV